MHTEKTTSSRCHTRKDAVTNGQISFDISMRKRSRSSLGRNEEQSKGELIDKSSKKTNRNENNLDPEDTPANLPNLSALIDENSEDHASIDLGKGTIPPGYDSASYMGPSHAEDPYLTQFIPKEDVKDGVIAFLTRSTRIVDENTAFTIYSRECECDDIIRNAYNSKWDQLQKTVAPYIDQLLALYFRFIDWTYPAVDIKRFYRAYFQKDIPLNRGLVSAMLGLGSTYWKYSTKLCVEPMPANLMNDLWMMSLHYIEHDINCSGPSLDTVRALLLYVQKRLASDGMHEQIACRIHVGKLVSLAYSLGLHLDCSNWDISDIEKSSRNRLWALVYYVDNWTAANLGHPGLLSGRPDSEKPLNFNSEWAQERRFVQLVRVTHILSKTLSQLYWTQEIALPPSPDRRCVQFQPQAVANDAESLLAELYDWKASLPKDLSDINALNTRKYCSNGMLHLSALAVETLIYRILIMPCYSGKYRHEARDLVQRIIVFCWEITHSHLHAYWIASCRLSMSSIAHFVLRYHAQSPEPERKKNTPLMRSWLECLRSLSHGWEEGVSLAYHRMDALFYKGQTPLKLPLIDDSLNAVDSMADMSRNFGMSPMQDLLSQDPIGLEDFTVPQDMEDSSLKLLFNNETLHDILQDLLWE